VVGDTEPVPAAPGGVRRRRAASVSLGPSGGRGRQVDRKFTSDEQGDEPVERVFGQLPDETWVYPGNGDDTTLGKERPSIPEWRARGW
jgi:hypothetical protein